MRSLLRLSDTRLLSRESSRMKSRAEQINRKQENSTVRVPIRNMLLESLPKST